MEEVNHADSAFISRAIVPRVVWPVLRTIVFLEDHRSCYATFTAIGLNEVLDVAFAIPVTSLLLLLDDGLRTK